MLLKSNIIRYLFSVKASPRKIAPSLPIEFYPKI